MRSTVLFASVLLPLLLASCGERKPATSAARPALAAAPHAGASAADPVALAARPPAPTPEQLEAGAAAVRERAVLMHAIFGDLFNSASNDAPMKLADPDQPGERMYAIEPVAHTFLPNGDAVLVAKALVEQPDRDGNRIHTEGGLLNIFIVRKTDGRWTLLKHHANIARMGSWERIGKAEFVNLAAGKPGLAMRFGSGFQQMSESAIGLFDLGADPIHALTGEGVAVAASSPGCVPEELETCYEIAANWRFAASASGAAYDDLVFTFTGQDDGKKDGRRKGEQGPVLAADMTGHKGSARYAYDGKRYVLVEGKNPAQEY
ncbi:hypothetical protein [Massilia sp. CCM 8734]|uniref:hypothetical protein n=1 Tax=Massilia sp. CCM 8734 TaxID=2609283 RepID=UPI001423EEB0|nr:hypothetical protein [Massilia sp. CCM 8734]NHZ94996.1 hypothetical protein [Massilia sp. CCM 8734]